MQSDEDNHETQSPIESASFDLNRRRFLATTAGVSVAAVAPAASNVAAQSEETVTIVHDTHFHGRFRNPDESELNIQRYYTVVEDVLNEYDNSVFVGIGDDLAPSLLGLEYEGAHMVDALNLMDITVDGVGNHEFDFGTDVAEQRFEDSDFPWVVANLLTDEGEPVPGTERWTTETIGDITVGFFGLVSENFHALTDYPAEWDVLDNVEAAEEAVTALTEEEGADITVAVAHISTGAHERVAENVDGLDAIVGSHSAAVNEEPENIGDTVNSEFGEEFDHVGVLTFGASGELIDWERIDLLPEAWDPLPEVEEYDEISTRAVADIDEHEGLDELYEQYQIPLDERLNEPYFHTATPLNWGFDNYAIETAGGNLLCDAIAAVEGIVEPDVDVAITNAGGIRANTTFEPGFITGSAVMETFPFPNEVWVIEVTGEELVNYFEDVQAPHPNENFGTQPSIQVSGVSYEWWGHNGESEIGNVFVGGEPIDPEETYTLAGPDFEIERNQYLDHEENEVWNSGQILGPFVLDTLEEWESVAPERENRMLRYDEEVGEADVSVTSSTVDVIFAEPDGAAELRTDSMRAVIRTGDEIEAEDARVDDGVVTVSFEHDALIELAREVKNPVLRVFGRYEADQDFWDYDFDIPTSDGYEYLKLKAPVDGTAVGELSTLSERVESLQEERDELQSELDEQEGEVSDLESEIESLNEEIEELEAQLEDAEDNSDDTNGADDSTDDTDDEEEDEDDDSVPGFGALAALVSAAGGAYAYSQWGQRDEETAD